MLQGEVSAAGPVFSRVQQVEKCGAFLSPVLTSGMLPHGAIPNTGVGGRGPAPGLISASNVDTAWKLSKTMSSREAF